MKKIVILGAGFGGLTCAKYLDKYFVKNPALSKDYEVILIDRNDYQTYTPTLYEIATTPEEIANLLELKTIVTFPLSYALMKTKVKFLQGEVKKINLKEKYVYLEPLVSADSRRIDFEYLVLALGNETN